MLASAFRFTENLVAVSLIVASAAAMGLAVRRDRLRRGMLDRDWPVGAAE